MIQHHVTLAFNAAPAAAPVILITGAPKRKPKAARFWFCVTGQTPEGQRVKGLFNEHSFTEALATFDSDLIHLGSLWISTDGIFEDSERRTLLRRKGESYYHVEPTAE